MPLGNPPWLHHAPFMLLRSAIKVFDDAVMPLRCVFCGTRTRDDELHICRGCRGDLPWLESPVQDRGALVHCEIAPLRYEFPIDAAIRAFKFRRRLFYGPAFAGLLCDACVNLPQDIDGVLPVPLHWRRKWWRGFNQAFEVALPLARHLGLPMLRGARRRRATPPQSGLTARQRSRNLRGAFAVYGRLRCRHVLIVDDVITTGTTVSQLAKVLRRAGVATVSIAAIARA